jgi:hypothetical protein
MSDDYDLNELGSMKATTFCRILYALLCRGVMQMKLAEQDKVCLGGSGFSPARIEAWSSRACVEGPARHQ